MRRALGQFLLQVCKRLELRFGSFFTRAQLPLLLPAQKVAALVGATVALLYVLLAGFGVPAQRTLYMLMVVAAALWMNRIAGLRGYWRAWVATAIFAGLRYSEQAWLRSDQIFLDEGLRSVPRNTEVALLKH